MDVGAKRFSVYIELLHMYYVHLILFSIIHNIEIDMLFYHLNFKYNLKPNADEIIFVMSLNLTMQTIYINSNEAHKLCHS